MDLSDLNDAQRRAVTSPNGEHLLIAGAGTGKTRTLVHRVAWLLEQGVPASNIVLLTFTRRAAREMLERVEVLVGPSARAVRGGTFHSFAQQTLRRHAPRVGFPHHFTVLDRGDAEGLMQLIRVEFGLNMKSRRFPSKAALLNIVSKRANTGMPIDELVSQELPDHVGDLPQIDQCVSRYAERKREQGVMDFDDLLIYLAQLLRDYPDVRAKVSGSAHHVLVDEYQDVNYLQAEISALLSAVHGNLMVVGDEAQSIYAFRGASIRFILDFPDIFPSAQVTVIAENYRSSQPILDVANAILAASKEGYEKQLVAAHDPDGPKPCFVEVWNEHEQTQGVVREVLALREQGFDLARQAVLFRSSSHANLLEVALTEAGIPYKKYGGIRFVESAHVKDVLALLRLAVNPKDTVAWMRVLTWLPGVGDRTASRWSTRLMTMAVPRLDAHAALGKRYYQDILDINDFLDEAGQHLQEPLAALHAALAFYVPRMSDLYEDARKRKAELEALDQLASRSSDLVTLLADLALDPVDAAQTSHHDGDQEMLTLSTIHSAKGLEWDVVHLIQLGDGAFPSSYAIGEDAAMEEERRLFYVAVTRARRRLVLWMPKTFNLDWGRQPVLSEGCELLEDLQPLSALFDSGRNGDTLVDEDTAVDYDQDALDEEDSRLARIRAYYGR